MFKKFPKGHDSAKSDKADKGPLYPSVTIPREKRGGRGGVWGIQLAAGTTGATVSSM